MGCGISRPRPGDQGLSHIQPSGPGYGDGDYIGGGDSDLIGQTNQPTMPHRGGKRRGQGGMMRGRGGMMRGGMMRGRIMRGAMMRGRGGRRGMEDMNEMDEMGGQEYREGMGNDYYGGAQETGVRRGMAGGGGFGLAGP